MQRRLEVRNWQCVGIDTCVDTCTYARCLGNQYFYFIAAVRKSIKPYRNIRATYLYITVEVGIVRIQLYSATFIE